MRWPWKKSAIAEAPNALEVPPPIAIVLPYSTMTLDHWHRSVPHLDYVRELFGQPMFRDMIAVLNNARPQAVGLHVDPTTAAIALGRREGFDMLLGIILQLPMSPPPPPVEVPADYAASNFDINQTT